MSKEFWEKAEKMTPEERKAARQTQWASACQDALREQEEKRESIGLKKNREGGRDEDDDKQDPEVRA